MPTSSLLLSASSTTDRTSEVVMRYLLRLQAMTIDALILAFTAGTGAQSPAKPPVKPDGLLHAELSLMGRTAAVLFAPDLRASDAAYKNLFAAAGQMQGRVKIGQLETNGALRLGSVSVGKPG